MEKNAIDPKFCILNREFPNESMREGMRPIDLGAGPKHPIETIQLNVRRTYSINSILYAC